MLSLRIKIQLVHHVQFMKNYQNAFNDRCYNSSIENKYYSSLSSCRRNNITIINKRRDMNVLALSSLCWDGYPLA
jgi:hypothetical protein